MDPAQAQPRALDAPEFVDGLGERALLTDPASGDSVELLQVRPALTSVPSFEFALRERTARLANFRQQAFARVRRVDRTPAGLAVVSDHVPGFRLSQMLKIAEERGLAVDTNAALSLIRQLLPAVALLHENARDVAHGALGPERLIVTPHARLVVAEYVLGSALEQLQLTHDRLWRDYRIPMPPSAGAPRFDHRADVMQIGITSLSLTLGRTLQDEELGRINELLAESTETSAGGARQPLSQGLRGWLARALQLDQRRPFLSVRDAQATLDQILTADSRYVASTVAVEAFISRCVDSIIEGTSAAVMPPVQPPAPVSATPVAPAPVSARAVPPVAVAPAAASPVRVAPPLVAPAPIGAVAVALPPPTPPVLGIPEVPFPVRPVEPQQAPEMPSTFELPHVPDLSRASMPFEPREAPRTLNAPDFDELQRTFSDDMSSLFSDVSELPDQISVQPSAPVTKKRRRLNPRLIRVAAVLVALVALAGAATYGGRKYFTPAPGSPAAETGTLLVESTPAGVQVVVDGEAHGATPARITLKAGPHILELRGRGLPRVMPLTMTAGGTLSQFVEFADAVAATSGQLDVRSDPAGAKVIVDGQPAGVAPMVVQSLSPGEHRVTLERDGATVQHTVTIEPGATASLVAPLGAAGGPVSGWVSVSAPFAMQVYEGGALIGTSESDRIMTSAGKHVFEIVNQALGYRVTRTVQVLPGKVAAIGIELPNGTVNVNAVPWAEVWIDNRRIGETPIANVSLPIGPHEVVFRHPQFGEKRQAISVTASAPVRVSVDMRN